MGRGQLRTRKARAQKAQASAGKKPTLLRKLTLVQGSNDSLPVHTCTFTASVNEERFQTSHGEVLNVLVPNHTPTPYSVSGQRAGEFDVTFKAYPNGRASGYLDSLQVGDELDVYRSGSKRRQAGRYVGVIAYGIGITEALPVAAAELANDDAEQVTLLWAVRRSGDVFWENEIDALKQQHGERFTCVVILSREEQSEVEVRKDVLHGRVGVEVLTQVFDVQWGTSVGGVNERFRSSVRFLAVGTGQMMFDTVDYLQKMGYAMPRQALLYH